MFWIAVIAAVSTAVTVGMGVGSMVAGKMQTDKAKRDEEEHSLDAAYVSYGTALNSAPSAVRT